MERLGRFFEAPGRSKPERVRADLDALEAWARVARHLPPPPAPPGSMAELMDRTPGLRHDDRFDLLETLIHEARVLLGDEESPAVPGPHYAEILAGRAEPGEPEAPVRADTPRQKTTEKNRNGTPAPEHDTLPPPSRFVLEPARPPHGEISEPPALAEETRPCSKCQTRPRLLGQRWCRGCLSAYARERRRLWRRATTKRLEPPGPGLSTCEWCGFPFRPKRPDGLDRFGCACCGMAGASLEADGKRIWKGHVQGCPGHAL